MCNLVNADCLGSSILISRYIYHNNFQLQAISKTYYLAVFKVLQSMSAMACKWFSFFKTCHHNTCLFMLADQICTIFAECVQLCYAPYTHIMLNALIPSEQY